MSQTHVESQTPALTIRGDIYAVAEVLAVTDAYLCCAVFVLATDSEIESTTYSSKDFRAVIAKTPPQEIVEAPEEADYFLLFGAVPGNERQFNSWSQENVGPSDVSARIVNLLLLHESDALYDLIEEDAPAVPEAPDPEPVTPQQSVAATPVSAEPTSTHPLDELPPPSDKAELPESVSSVQLDTQHDVPEIAPQIDSTAKLETETETETETVSAAAPSVLEPASIDAQTSALALQYAAFQREVSEVEASINSDGLTISELDAHYERLVQLQYNALAQATDKDHISQILGATKRKQQAAHFSAGELALAALDLEGAERAFRAAGDAAQAQKSLSGLQAYKRARLAIKQGNLSQAESELALVSDELGQHDNVWQAAHTTSKSLLETATLLADNKLTAHPDTVTQTLETVRVALNRLPEATDPIVQAGFVEQIAAQRQNIAAQEKRIPALTLVHFWGLVEDEFDQVDIDFPKALGFINQANKINLQLPEDAIKHKNSARNDFRKYMRLAWQTLDAAPQDAALFWEAAKALGKKLLDNRALMLISDEFFPANQQSSIESALTDLYRDATAWEAFLPQVDAVRIRELAAAIDTVDPTAAGFFVEAPAPEPDAPIEVEVKSEPVVVVTPTATAAPAVITPQPQVAAVDETPSKVKEATAPNSESATAVNASVDKSGVALRWLGNVAALAAVIGLGFLAWRYVEDTWLNYAQGPQNAVIINADALSLSTPTAEFKGLLEVPTATLVPTATPITFAEEPCGARLNRSITMFDLAGFAETNWIGKLSEATCYTLLAADVDEKFDQIEVYGWLDPKELEIVAQTSDTLRFLPVAETTAGFYQTKPTATVEPVFYLSIRRSDDTSLHEAQLLHTEDGLHYVKITGRILVEDQ